jgi:hypothetical protein
MEIETLSRLLRDLLLVNDRVSLPGMGSFIAELAPSVFSDRATVIHPPFRRIMFRTSEVWNDELLENLYADENNLDIEAAREEIAVFVKELKASLNIRKNIQIPGFGTMRATDQKDYFFVANKDLFIFPDGFGLEPLNIKPLAKQGLIELLDKDEMRFSRSELKAERRSDRKREKENEKAKKEIIIREESEAGARTEGLTDKNRVRGRIKIFPAIILIVLLLIVAVALLFIFRDEVRPFWEWLLYNKEERELLKYLL